MGTLAFYFLVIIFCAAMAERAVRFGKKRWLLAAIILLSVVAGCRAASVGTDTGRVMAALYYDMGRDVFAHSKDYLYYFLGKVLMRVWANPSFVLTVFALITNGAVLLRLWDFSGDSSGNFSMFLAVCLYGFFYFGTSMNIVRQMMAVSLIFYFSRSLFKQKYIRFCLGAIMAFFIHISACIAIMLLPVYLIYFNSPGAKRIRLSRGCIALFSTIGTVLLVFFLGGQYDDYLEFSGIRIGLMQLITLCVLLVVYFACSASLRSGKTTGQEISSQGDIRFFFLLSLIGYCLFLAGYVMADIGRFSYYFRIFEIVFYGMVLKHKQVDPSTKVIMGILLFLIGMYTLYTYGGIIPYHFVWQSN